MDKLFNEWKVAYLAKGGEKLTEREEGLFQDFFRWAQWRAAEQPRALDEFESCVKCHHPNKVGFVKCAWCKTTRQ